MINFDVLPRAYQAIALQQVAHLQQWRTQDFSMGGVSGTSHRDDVKILRSSKRGVTSEKLDYRYCCIWHPMHLNERLSRFKLERWTEQKKHDGNFGQLRTKKSRFVSKLKKVSFFLHSSREGGDSRLPPLHTPLGSISVT